MVNLKQFLIKYAKITADSVQIMVLSFDKDNWSVIASHPFQIIPKCSNLSIFFWITFFCSSLIGYGHTKKGVSSFNLRWTSINGHVPISSLRLKTSWKSSVLVRNSSLPLSSSNKSSKFNLCLNISASIMCLLLSSGSSHGYLSSLVGTLVLSVFVSVHVDILGISDGSIGLSYAKGLDSKLLA